MPEIDEGGSAAATMVGYPWTARGEAPVAGSRANCKLRSSSSSIDVDVKKHEQGTAAHTPEVRSGRSRVGVGLGAQFDAIVNFLRRVTRTRRSSDRGAALWQIFIFIIIIIIISSLNN